MGIVCFYCVIKQEEAGGAGARPATGGGGGGGAPLAVAGFVTTLQCVFAYCKMGCSQ